MECDVLGPHWVITIISAIVKCNAIVYFVFLAVDLKETMNTYPFMNTYCNVYFLYTDLSHILYG